MYMNMIEETKSVEKENDAGLTVKSNYTFEIFTMIYLLPSQELVSQIKSDQHGLFALFFWLIST